ncbi:MAG: Na+/H+ antiporter NhaC family protein [Anaerovoracaceae bacterium]
MDYGLISCIPITVLVVGALLTKRIAEMMIISSIIGAIFVHRSNFFSGYIEMMYGVLSNPSYQFVLIILMAFGAMIRLSQKSGALLGFGQIMSKFAGGPKKPLLIAWAMSFLMFIDDYIGTLAISFGMKDITDKSNIPREHLAYQVGSMSPSICVLVPFSSWTAFTVGLISQQGLGFSDYLKAIPFMYFPFFTLIVCLLVACGIIPKVGLLKKSYERVQQGGAVLVKEEVGVSIVDLDVTIDKKPSSSLNFVIPIVVLVLVTMLYDNDLVHGLLAAIVVQGVLYIPQKTMTPTEFVTNCFEGAKSMCNIALIVFFAFILNSANQIIGFSDFFIRGIGESVPVQFLPLAVFLIVAFTTFATAGYWVVQVITIPIFIPLAAATGLNPSIAIAAIMSGVTFGGILCFYSDIVFMTAAGTGVANIRQVKVAAPYVLGTVVLASICYVVAGFLM